MGEHVAYRRHAAGRLASALAVVVALSACQRAATSAAANAASAETPGAAQMQPASAQSAVNPPADFLAAAVVDKAPWSLGTDQYEITCVTPADFYSHYVSADRAWEQTGADTYILRVSGVDQLTHSTWTKSFEFVRSRLPVEQGAAPTPCDVKRSSMVALSRVADNDVPGNIVELQSALDAVKADHPQAAAQPKPQPKPNTVTVLGPSGDARAYRADANGNPDHSQPVTGGNPQ